MSELTQRDIEGLTFVAEMYAVQYDQVATLLDMSYAAVAMMMVRWRDLGYARTASLGDGSPWVWVTQQGMKALGLPYKGEQPALVRLRHLRAVTAIRLRYAASEVEIYREGVWCSERKIRSRYRETIRDHMPDGELMVPSMTERFAIEAELTPKSVHRTAEIMRELIGRRCDYGPGNGYYASTGHPFYLAIYYYCSEAALPVVTRAKASLRDGDAVMVFPLPPAAR